MYMKRNKDYKRTKVKKETEIKYFLASNISKIDSGNTELRHYVLRIPKFKNYIVSNNCTLSLYSEEIKIFQHSLGALPSGYQTNVAISLSRCTSVYL